MQLNEHSKTRVLKALPAKGMHKNLKVCFPNTSVQFGVTGAKPQFAEIFRYYITEAQIIQNRGSRSTINWFPRALMKDATAAFQEDGNRKMATILDSIVNGHVDLAPPGGG